MSASLHDHAGGVANDRPFHRYTTRNRCPHCDHETPCIYFDNGDVLCHRDGDAHRWTDSFIGGYWHRAADAGDTRPTPRRTPAPSAPTITPADLTTRDAVYTDLLALCPLTGAQRAAQRLTQAQADRYGWLPGDPDSQARLIAALLTTHTREELLSVPGFRDQRGRLTIRGAGLMLPTRDLDGKIQALDLRRAVVKEGQSRYIKLSSRTDDDPDAPSPGAPPHVAMPVDGVAVPGHVAVTEGIKKADAAADALGYPVISIPGISATRAASSVLERVAGDVVVIMLDQDDPEKNDGRTVANVERARADLAALAIPLGYAVRLATWNHARGKGIDDLLAKGDRFILERYRPDLNLMRDPDHGEGGDTATEDGANGGRPGAPTLEDALALPHPTLARRYVDARARLRAADDVLAYIGRITKHQAVITPSDDPDAKRRRPVLSHADRVIGVNYALDMRAAGKGLLPTAPVPLWRGQLATASCASPSTVTASTQQLARVGFLAVTPAPGDREAQLFALPATMPGDLSPDNLIDFESTRRRKERGRRCECGGTRFKQTTVCLTCGKIDVEILGDDLDPVEPVARCNTRVTVNDEGSTTENVSSRRGGVVADCTRSRTERERTALRDRHARDGHRASRDDTPQEAPHVSSRDASPARPPSPLPQQPLAALPDEQHADMKPCGGRCGRLTPHGWTCKPCRERPVGSLHIPNRSATGQEGRHGR